MWRLLPWALALGALLWARVERQRAEQDPLTGLPNRRGLARAWAGRPAGWRLHVVDLRGFKQVNDRLGHPAGDRVLRRFARALGSEARPGTVARIGGDEFALLLEGTADPAPAVARALGATGAEGLGFWIGTAPEAATRLDAALSQAFADLRARRARVQTGFNRKESHAVA